MSTNFPSALDTFTNPNGSDSLNAAAVPHAEQHANANDAIEALQAKVGINGSAVATSLDYRISAAETGLGGKISSSEKGSANGVATLGFDGKVPSSQLPPLDYIPTSEKGAAGGVAGLDESGKVPAAQLPSYVDDVLEYANLAAFPVTGETGKIYVALDTNKTYRWSGSAYVYITSGAVDSVAGKTGVVALTKADVGLGSVDNTSDANKPISTATQLALDGKAPSTHVGETGTAHGVATTLVAGFMSAADKSKLDGVAASANNYSHPTGDGDLHVPATGTTNNGKVLKAGATAGSLSWGTLGKTDVGLGSVDNTSDANKPVSTAQQSALDLKLNTSGGAITANSASAALTITQTGSGNAFVVEDSASPDSTPFVIDADGRVIVGSSTLVSYGADIGTARTQYNYTVGNGLVVSRWSANQPGQNLYLAKSRGAEVGTRAQVALNDILGTFGFTGDDGTSFVAGAKIASEVDATPATGSMPGRLTFSTTPSGSATPVERMRIDSIGNVGIGGAASAGYTLHLSKNLTGSATAIGVMSSATIQSDVTNVARSFSSTLSTAAASFTLTSLRHFMANQGTIGAGSTVTAQYGFFAEGSLTGATNNYGFYGNIPAGTGRYNFYAAGAAANYFAGNVTANAAFNQTPTRSTAASGSTVTLTTGTNHLLYDQAGTVAELTVTLPSASLSDGQVITIATRSAITALTINGGTIYGAPTSLAAGGFCSFIYSSGGAAWFRKG